MIKKIRFTDSIIKYNTKTGDGFDEVLGVFDRKIRFMVTKWIGQIPNHDVDDLSQICRMKLVEALAKYDDKRNINFSTYVYTVWHRKLAQLSYQYKTKKHSRSIANDNYVSFNYAMDKTNNAFYLMLGKHKCPLTKKIIDSKTCHGCEHHVAYKSKKVNRGFDSGQKKKFTVCKYAMGILEQRGANTISLDKPIRTDSGVVNLSNLIPEKSQVEDIAFKLDFEALGKRIDQKTSKLDSLSFDILRLMIDGQTKSEIIKELKTTSLEFDKKIKQLMTNKDIKNLLD